MASWSVLNERTEASSTGAELPLAVECSIIDTDGEVFVYCRTLENKVCSVFLADDKRRCWIGTAVVKPTHLSACRARNSTSIDLPTKFFIVFANRVIVVVLFSSSGFGVLLLRPIFCRHCLIIYPHLMSETK